MLLKDVCVDKTKEELLQIYKYATYERFSVLLIDCDAPDEKRHRKNFLDYL